MLWRWVWLLTELHQLVPILPQDALPLRIILCQHRVTLERSPKPSPLGKEHQTEQVCGDGHHNSQPHV